MPQPHRKTTSRADQRRKRRRQRREEPQVSQQPASEPRAPATRPVQMSVNRSPRPARDVSAVTSLDRETEYRLTRQDLWRLAIYSTICLTLMIAVLIAVEG